MGRALPKRPTNEPTNVRRPESLTSNQDGYFSVPDSRVMSQRPMIACSWVLVRRWASTAGARAMATNRANTPNPRQCVLLNHMVHSPPQGISKRFSCSDHTVLVTRFQKPVVEWAVQGLGALGQS